MCPGVAVGVATAGAVTVTGKMTATQKALSGMAALLSLLFHAPSTPKILTV